MLTQKLPAILFCVLLLSASATPEAPFRSSQQRGSFLPMLFQGTPGFQAPSSIDFGGGLVGTPISLEPTCCAEIGVPISNPGTATLNISSYTVTGPNASDFFTFVSPDVPLPPPNSVSTGQSIMAFMDFIPSGTGPESATLVIQDDATGSPHQISLTGVGIGPGDFGIGPSAASVSATVQAGQTASFTIRSAAGAGFVGTGTLSCSGLPPGASCGGPAIGISDKSLLFTTFGVTTTAPATASTGHLPVMWPWYAAAMLALVLFYRNARLLSRRVQLVVAMALLTIVVSCGGGSSSSSNRTPTPKGTFTFTATATSGNTSSSTHFILVVQ